MKTHQVKVLLVRRSQNGHSPLTKRLVAHGCKCWFAASARDVLVLLDEHSFDLVLGPIRLGAASLYSLIDRLAGSETTLFYSLGVEDGCWWLPALRQGENCFGAPAIHHRGFITALEKALDEIKATARETADALSHPPPAGATARSIAASTVKVPVPAPPASSKIITIAARRTARP